MKKPMIAILMVLIVFGALTVIEADDSRAGWEGIGPRWMYEGLECFYVGPLQSTGNDGFSFGFNWQWYPGAIEFWPDRTFFKGSEVSFDGRVGIGDSTPNYALDVESDNSRVINAEYTGTASTASAVFGDCSPGDDKGFGGYFVGGRTGAVGLVSSTGSSTYKGISGQADGGSGHNYGVYGNAGASSNQCYGVLGEASASGTGKSYGVFGEADGPDFNCGVYGRVLNPSTSYNYGLIGYIEGGQGYQYGIRAFSYGSSSEEYYAGKFSGDVLVEGTLSKTAGSFRIDHPLDPENKYLFHSFVESPDMKNVYDGTVVLDGAGDAVVVLPEYFQALNKDFRYQLTCIGGWAPVYIAQEIENNEFIIAGGETGLKVSWQVTGIRKDPYAERSRIQVEVEKSERERGKYLHPEVYDLPEEYGVNYEEAQRLREGRQGPSRSKVSHEENSE